MIGCDNVDVSTVISLCSIEAIEIKGKTVVLTTVLYFPKLAFLCYIFPNWENIARLVSKRGKYSTRMPIRENIAHSRESNSSKSTFNTLARF